MYEADTFLRNDPEYRSGIRLIHTALTVEFLGCEYHPEGGRAINGKIVDGSFVGGAVFTTGRLGHGPTLALDRMEIQACHGGITAEVGQKIDEFVSRVKCLALIWTSQNGTVEIECGRYASIPEATADRASAEMRLHELYPESDDFHHPHDIKAGTWRVVPRAPEIRAQRRPLTENTGS